MTMEETIKILAVLKAAYPNSYKNMTTEEASGTVAVWAVQFANIPVDIVFMALNKAISTCKYPPSICEVKEKLTALHWEAYEAVFIECKRKRLPETTLKEYKRIYEVTRNYKTKMIEPTLKSLLKSGSQKFLNE